VGGTNLADGSGSVDFGQTQMGTPITRTFTVGNVGTETLTLGSVINVPASGYTLASGFGTTSLESGQSTTFSVRLDAGTSGSYGGQVSFTSNDADEGTFNFEVSGSVTSAQIVDEGGIDYSTVGNWGYCPYIGYGGDIQFSRAGTGNDVAAWTFNVTPGQYQVAGTWSGEPNRATNAPFTILDGSTPLETVRVNQEWNPNDFTDQGANWETLGTYNITGTTLKVQLSDDANEYVIADAIRIQRLGDLPSEPEIQVEMGGSNRADGTGSVDFGQTQGGTPVIKTFTVRNVGTETLTLGSSINVPAFGFSVASGFGSTSLESGESTTFSVSLDADADGSYAGQVSFTTNDADEGTFNFAVSGSASSVQIVDEGGVNYSTVGNWGYCPYIGYGGDIQFSRAGTGADVAAWTFNVIPGQYQVAGTWSGEPNRATDSPFAILDGSTVVGTVRVNQEWAPNDFTDQGADWEVLGNYNITGSTLKVQLSDDANEYVIADAIRIRRLGDVTGGPVEQPSQLSGPCQAPLAGALPAADGVPQAHANALDAALTDYAADVAAWQYRLDAASCYGGAWQQGTLSGYGSSMEAASLSQLTCSGNSTSANGQNNRLRAVDLLLETQGPWAAL